ncbi:MAG: hypothetical protein M3343_06355 [Actinomycetota bacterium]|nr:hypothetical protein [Actinomycetota bacterium]
MSATADRVERATLPELRDVHIDDVYVQMDFLLQSRPTPLDLYHRWENQNWSTQKLDFTEDRGATNPVTSTSACAPSWRPE